MTDKISFRKDTVLFTYRGGTNMNPIWRNFSIPIPKGYLMATFMDNLKKCLEMLDDVQTGRKKDLKESLGSRDRFLVKAGIDSAELKGRHNLGRVRYSKICVEIPVPGEDGSVLSTGYFPLECAKLLVAYWETRPVVDTPEPLPEDLFFDPIEKLEVGKARKKASDRIAEENARVDRYEREVAASGLPDDIREDFLKFVRARRDNAVTMVGKALKLKLSRLHDEGEKRRLLDIKGDVESVLPKKTPVKVEGRMYPNLVIEWEFTPNRMLRHRFRGTVNASLTATAAARFSLVIESLDNYGAADKYPVTLKDITLTELKEALRWFMEKIPGSF